jgi:TetR/AcrR family transcriptional regulator, transcriptional repressor for nem operon
MTKLATPVDGAPGDSNQQRRIVEVATRLFIAHGYHGVSYLHIARELGINHSNVHYYFRVKAMLAEAVLRQVADATLDSMRMIWVDPKTTLLDKMLSTRDWMLEHYLQFNPDGKGGHSWGLLARFTMDSQALSLPMKTLMRGTLQQIEDYIAQGVGLAVQSGELVDDVPQASITLQINSVVLVSGLTTRSGRGFGRLEDLMKGTYFSIARAYGRRGSRSVRWVQAKVP